MPDDQHFDRVHKRQNDVRQDFANHQFPGANGGDDELFDRASLAFAYDRACCEQGCDHEQNLSDHAGHIEISGDKIRVVPDLCADFQRRVEGSDPSRKRGLVF